MSHDEIEEIGYNDGLRGIKYPSHFCNNPLYTEITQRIYISGWLHGMAEWISYTWSGGKS